MVGVRSGLAIYSIFLIILIVPIESSIMYNSNFFNSTYSKLSSSNLEDKEKTDFLIGE